MNLGVLPFSHDNGMKKKFSPMLSQRWRHFNIITTFEMTGKTSRRYKISVVLFSICCLYCTVYSMAVSTWLNAVRQKNVL